MAVWSIGVLQVLATVAMYVSLQQLTLSEHVTVACTLPFATALLSWVWLGDRLTRAQVLCCGESHVTGQDERADFTSSERFWGRPHR
jgi:drug/metabolite transporter (DMT)-like permease